MTFIQMPNGERYQLVRSGLYDPLGPHQTGLRGWRLQHPWIDRLDLPHLVRLWQQLYGLGQTSLATPKQMRKQIATDLSTGQLQLVSYAAPSDSMEAAENAKKQALNTISQHMRSIIDDEKRQAAEIAKKYEAQGTLGKAVDQGMALGTGVVKAGFDFAKWVKDGHDLINPATRAKNMATAIYSGVQAGSAKVMMERLQAEEKRELVEFVGFDPTKITAEQREAAKEVAALLYDDADTRQLFIQFFKDYASAQHSTEIVEVSGGLLFEVLMDLAIAAVTLGLGTPVLLAKKAYWIQKFNKVLDAIKELIVALKKMALNIKRRVVNYLSNPTASNSSPASKYDKVDQTMHEAGTSGQGGEAGKIAGDDGVGGATNRIDELGSYTATGSEIFHGKTVTRIGGDEVSIRVTANSARVDGVHDVVVHGTPYDDVGAIFSVDGLPTNANQIADAIKLNPNYKGEPIRLLTCYGGCGPAQEIANILKVPVQGATKPVGVSRAPNSVPFVTQGGEWLNFLPE
jgi:hypothetical protein